MTGSKWLKPIKTVRSNNTESTSLEAEPLSPSARLFHAPRLNCCIIAVIGCKKQIDVQVIKDGVVHSFVKHPRFSSKLVFDDKKAGRPVGWVRTKVNVDDHVIVPDLDPNMDSPDQFLGDYVTNLTKTSMDLTKPLWELHILNIKTTDANAVGVLKIHHSIGDGISLMSLVLACTRQSSNPEVPPTLPIDHKKKTLRPNNSFGFLSCFFGLLLILKMLWNTLIDLILFMATTIWLKDTDTPVKGAAAPELAPKRLVYRTFSLDDIKLVKKATDATINDVVLGMTQAGLSKYLNRKYGEAKGEEKVGENHLPKHIRLRATLLVNLRPTNTIEDLAEKMEADYKGKWEWGNSIGYVLIPLHIELRDNPLDYIRTAKATIDKKKQSFEAPCTYGTARITLMALGLRVVAALTHRILCHATMSFSNVVGPLEETSFYGHPISFLAPTVYGHPQALTVHFQSYMDKMTLVIAVDQDVIPDPQKLCDDIEESLKFAKKAVIEKKLVQS